MHPSVADLEARVRRVPQVLREALAVPPPQGLRQLGDTSVVLTGIGASEAVARSLEPLFRQELRVRVTQLPLSSFVADDVKMQGQTLVLLSQELSPNVQWALRRVREFQQALLVTSVGEDDARLAEFRRAGGLVWTLPPPEERGLLVRVMGPMAAGLALARLAYEGAAPLLPAGLGAVAARVEAATAAGFREAEAWPLEVTRAPFVAAGWYARCLELASWTWMEALWVEPPPLWDALSTAHGPWQQRFAAPGPWLGFTRPDDVPELWARFERMLAGHGHRLVRVPATLPGALAQFEHLGFVQGLTTGLLRRAPRDLTRWPGQGSDAPLYEWAAADRPASP